MGHGPHILSTVYALQIPAFLDSIDELDKQERRQGAEKVGLSMFRYSCFFAPTIYRVG